MSVIAELSLFPTGVAGSLAPYVARAVKVIEASGLPYEVNSMGTCVEGDFQEVMDVVAKCFEAVKHGQDRVYMTLKLDWRAGRVGGLAGKTASVARAMGDGK